MEANYPERPVIPAAARNMEAFGFYDRGPRDVRNGSKSGHWSAVQALSAFPQKADMLSAEIDVR